MQDKPRYVEPRIQTIRFTGETMGPLLGNAIVKFSYLLDGEKVTITRATFDAALGLYESDRQVVDSKNRQ